MTISSRDPFCPWVQSREEFLAEYGRYIEEAVHEADKDMALFFCKHLQDGRYPAHFLSAVSANGAVKLGIVFA